MTGPMTAPARRPVVAVGPRLRARAGQQRRDSRRRRVRRASFTALALVPVLVLSWVLLASPLLQVSRVVVTGTTLVSPQDVLAAADVRTGTPLARVDDAAVHRRVAALAPVARVRVVRAWPHTLRLQVSERTALAAVHGPDGSWSLVDAAGVRFGPSAEAPPGLPELQATDAATGGTAVRVLAEVPATLRGQVAEVRTPSPSSVALVLRDGHTVVWGQPGQAARKAAVVAALLTRPGTTIDVTSPGVAVVH